MRRFLVSLSCWWVFRTPETYAKHLRGLAATEQGSYFSLQWAAQMSPSLARQALYLRHAADEARHAHLFWSRAAALVPPCGPLLADGEDLFAALGEVRFLAFVHHAEQRGREQFECYQRYFTRRARQEDAALFARVCADERHHESYSKKLLVELSGSEAQAKRHLRRVRLWEAWRSYMRAGQGVAHALYSLLIWALLPLLLPYSLLLRLRPKEPTGFRSPMGSKLKSKRPKELTGG